MTAEEAPAGGYRTVFPILVAIGFCHFLNDMMQSLMPAMYPLLKTGFQLNFAQVGLITLTYQCTASLLQPLVGFATDRHPQPYSLAAGMASTLIHRNRVGHAVGGDAIIAHHNLLCPRRADECQAGKGGRHYQAPSHRRHHAFLPTLAAFWGPYRCSKARRRFSPSHEQSCGRRPRSAARKAVIVRPASDWVVRDRC